MEQIGISPGKYIQEKRIQEAQVLERQMNMLADMTLAELKARFLKLYGFECGATNAKGLRHRLASDPVRRRRDAGPASAAEDPHRARHGGAVCRARKELPVRWADQKSCSGWSEMVRGGEGTQVLPHALAASTDGSDHSGEQIRDRTAMAAHIPKGVVR